MTETTRFGLEKFGGQLGGSIADNGGKFSSTDRDLIDRILAVFEDHKHDGGWTPAALASPTVAAASTLHTTGGIIGRGTTRYYKYSLIDQFGLETAASPEIAVALPALITITDFPVITGSTGMGSTLAEGSYYYALTGNTSEGQTPLGPESIITVQTGQNQVDIVLPALPSGVTSWNVWRQGVTEEGWTKVFDSQAPGTVTDVGFASGACLCDPTTQPPTDDLAPTGTYSITITPDSGALASAVSWRLYESDISGNYSSASLVAAVVPGVVGDPPPVDYLDTGAALVAGQPLLISTTLKPSHAVSGGGGGGADSHFVSHLATQVASLVSGTAFPAYIESLAYDLVGHDITIVYETNSDFGAGDELQVNTDGVYNRIITVEADGFAAGDVVGVELATASVGAGDFDLTTYAETPRQVIVPPGSGSSYAAGVVGPAIFMAKGTRISAHVIPYFTGSPTGVKVGLGLAMVSGTPADAEVFPGVSGLTVTPGATQLVVAWTALTGGGIIGYDVLLYSGGVPVPGYATGTSGTTVTFTGLTNGVTYTVIVLGRKTLAGGVLLYSTPALEDGVPAAPATGAFTDDFNRADGTALGLPNYPLIGGNPSGLLETLGNKMVNAGSAGPTFAGHDLAFVDKIIGFTHFADTGLPLIVYLGTDSGTGNPQASVALTGSISAPIIDYYDSGGAHTAITMSAVGGAWVAYQSSSAAIEVRLFGVNVEVYQGGVLCWNAVLPDYLAGQTYMEIGMFPGLTAIDDLSVAEYTVTDDPGSVTTVTGTPTGGGGVTVTWDIANGVTPDHFHVIIQEGFTYSDFLNVPVASPRTAAFTGATPGAGYTARVAPLAPDGTIGTYVTSSTFTVT